MTACGAPDEPVAVGSEMPSFKLPMRDGSKLVGESLAGAPAVISFWATWCQPCLKDIPELNELVARDGLAVFAVALDEEGWGVIDPFLEQRPLRATVLLGNEDVFRRFGGFTIPYTMVVDGKGIIRAIFRGPVTRRQVLDSLELPSRVGEPVESLSLLSTEETRAHPSS